MPFLKNLHSKHLLWLAAIGWLIFSWLVGLSVGAWQDNQLKAQLQEQMHAQIQLRIGFLREQIDHGRQALLFLAHTPPVDGLARASQAGGVDLRDNNSAAQWKDRLGTIFVNYARYTPGILQLNLTGFADNGLELVRVNHHGGEPVLIAASRLRSRGGGMVLQSGASLQEGEVAASDIELYRENGVILRPLVPWIRFWTTCFTNDHHRFAVLLLAIDASSLLAPLLARDQGPAWSLYVTNQNGLFLSHPDPRKTFGADLGKPWNWNDEFASAAPLPGFPALRVLSGRNGVGYFASSERFAMPHLAQRQHWLTVTLAVPAAVIADKVRQLELTVFASLVLAGAAAALLMLAFRRQRRALHAHQAELAAIVSSAQEAVIGYLEDGTVTSWNPAASRLFGLATAEAIGANLFALIVPESLREDARRSAQRAADRQNVPMRETQRLCQDGRMVDVILSTTYTHTGEDGVPRLADTIRDITQQKESEARVQAVNALLERRIQHELHSTRDKLGIAVDMAELGIWNWELADNRLIWNERMFDIYGYPRTQAQSGVSYADWRERVHPDDLPRVEALLQSTVAGVGVYDPTFRVQWPDGRIRFVQAGGRVERDDEGRPIRVFGINRDITAQRAYEDTLNAAREQAEAASRAKADFLSNMSHEIRTPMNAILGLAFLLEKAELPGHARELVQKIRSAGRSLLGIINDILDFSKIESGNLTLERAPFSLSRLLDNLSTIMATSAGDKELELVIKPPPGVDLLQGDALRLEQVLINLTSNAIKFTERGFVEVDIRTLAQDEETVRLSFAITDSGIGIAAEQQTELFRPFTQADASTTRRFGGTGLGLAISRQLVDLMGGSIRLRSAPGVGSCFSFELVLPRERETRYAPPELAGLSVFIADDNDIALEALRVAAGGLDWRAQTASSGSEAMEILRKNADFDVVILDWKMPDHSGLDVAKDYYQSLQGKIRPIVLMVTAYARETLLEEPDIALVDGVIVKPVTPSVLYNAVAHAVRMRQGVGGGSETLSARQRLDGVRLLVVDDSDINRDVAERIFRYEGAEVYLACDGQQALDWLDAHPAGVDLVLMDIQMPVMDGFEASRRIRQLPQWRELPIVALTAGVFKTHSDAARAAGMDDYIAKPFDIDLAVDRIRHACGLDIEDRGSRPVPAHEPGAATLNIALGLEIWREEAVYQQYLRKFARDYQTIVQQISACDADAARQLAHKLKGVAGNLALSEVEDAARHINDALSNGGETAPALAGLAQALTLALAAIRRYAGDDDPGEEWLPVVSSAVLAERFDILLAALDSDDIDRIEAALQPLAEQLGSAVSSGLRSAVEDFDFRRAEHLVLGLALRLLPPSEVKP